MKKRSKVTLDNLEKIVVRIQEGGAVVAVCDITSGLTLTGYREYFKQLSVGGEFFVRYVPQSRYFQSQELEIQSFEFTENMLNELNDKKEFHFKRMLDLENGTIDIIEG